MAKIEDGTSGAIVAGVDSGSRALRVSPRPMDALGHYRYAASTGILSSIGGLSDLVQVRWSDNASLALIHFIRFRLVQLAAYTTPQEILLEMMSVHGYTASGGGGTATLPALNNLKKRSSFPNSRMADLRISSTASLSPGTRQNYTSLLFSQSAFVSGPGMVMDTKLDMPGTSAEQPLVLAQNEGFVLRLGNLGMGAGGTARLMFDMAWSEVATGSL